MWTENAVMENAAYSAMWGSSPHGSPEWPIEMYTEYLYKMINIFCSIIMLFRYMYTLADAQLGSIVLAGPALLLCLRGHPHNTPSALDLSV